MKWKRLNSLHDSITYEAEHGPSIKYVPDLQQKFKVDVAFDLTAPNGEYFCFNIIPQGNKMNSTEQACVGTPKYAYTSTTTIRTRPSIEVVPDAYNDRVALRHIDNYYNSNKNTVEPVSIDLTVEELQAALKVAKQHRKNRKNKMAEIVKNQVIDLKNSIKTLEAMP